MCIRDRNGSVMLKRKFEMRLSLSILFWYGSVQCESIDLSENEASNLLKLPLSCVEVEYPNKLGQVLNSDVDLLSPRTLHPSFYGCFDWHSAVHGHWSLVRLLKVFPEIEGADFAKRILEKHLTDKNIQRELKYVQENPSWERPYGWAWLLQLASEIYTWDDPLARKLDNSLRPLASEISKLYINHLPKLVYPIRVGEHSNTAFGLTFAWDYAVLLGDNKLQSAIENRAKDFYLGDKDCPITWEPSGYDFLSPCLTELDLMRRILPKETFKKLSLIHI